MGQDAPRDIPASDLANALSNLKTDQLARATADPATPVSIASDVQLKARSRSSTVIFHPECGDSPNLPAVMVEDMSLAPEGDVDMDVDASPIEMSVDRMSL